MSDSLCTKDRNIRDAMEHMKILQDATITSSMKEHTKFEGDVKNIIDEAALRKLEDLDLKEILDKRFTELN